MDNNYRVRSNAASGQRDFHPDRAPSHTAGRTVAVEQAYNGIDEQDDFVASAMAMIQLFVETSPTAQRFKQQGRRPPDPLTLVAENRDDKVRRYYGDEVYQLCVELRDTQQECLDQLEYGNRQPSRQIVPLRADREERDRPSRSRERSSGRESRRSGRRSHSRTDRERSSRDAVQTNDRYSRSQERRSIRHSDRSDPETSRSRSISRADDEIRSIRQSRSQERSLKRETRSEREQHRREKSVPRDFGSRSTGIDNRVGTQPAQHFSTPDGSFPAPPSYQEAVRMSAEQARGGGRAHTHTETPVAQGTRLNRTMTGTDALDEILLEIGISRSLIADMHIPDRGYDGEGMLLGDLDECLKQARDEFYGKQSVDRSAVKKHTNRLKRMRRTMYQAVRSDDAKIYNYPVRVGLANDDERWICGPNTFIQVVVVQGSYDYYFVRPAVNPDQEAMQEKLRKMVQILRQDESHGRVKDLDNLFGEYGGALSVTSSIESLVPDAYKLRFVQLDPKNKDMDHHFKSDRARVYLRSGNNHWIAYVRNRDNSVDMIDDGYIKRNHYTSIDKMLRSIRAERGYWRRFQLSVLSELPCNAHTVGLRVSEQNLWRDVTNKYGIGGELLDIEDTPLSLDTFGAIQHAIEEWDRLEQQKKEEEQARILEALAKQQKRENKNRRSRSSSRSRRVK